MHHRSRNEVLAIVLSTLASVNPTLASADADTPLLGGMAAVDSVGFVTLLVSLEQNLSDDSLVTAFMELGGVAEEDHPFRTVGTLADHIHRRQAAPAA
jgi:hypothetical protein